VLTGNKVIMYVNVQNQTGIFIRPPHTIRSNPYSTLQNKDMSLHSLFPSLDMKFIRFQDSCVLTLLAHILAVDPVQKVRVWTSHVMYLPARKEHKG
jgi:hypothetical protein